VTEFGPTEPLSQYIHETKYRQEGETFLDSVSRISNHLKDDDEHYHSTRDILKNQRFLPAGRIQSACGATRQVTPYNCFVSGTIADTLTGPNGILPRASEAAETMRMGGGIGYDFSTLRPKGDLIKSLDSVSSGPLSFMSIYDSICRTIASAGHRRGAQMGVLRVDHPDILEFVNAKHDESSLRGFNISVGITDNFMYAVESGTDFSLNFGGKSYRNIDARSLWEQIMRSTYDWAEPGVIFLDTINSDNNLWYCEEISATNPCGEQPLPPHGACLLGSFNLTRYMEPQGKIHEGFEIYKFNWDQLIHDIPIIVRAMDNVIDRAIYPLPSQEIEAKTKRRMGLGITGFANTVEALGHSYGSPLANQFLTKILDTLNEVAYETSISLAIEKGPFPAFQAVSYAKKGFASRLPERIRGLIREHGIRNSHLTSIAPTGTISLAADNVSSGIEPVWQKSYERIIQTFNGPVVHSVTDYGSRVFGNSPRTVSDCTLDDHLNTLLVASTRVDSAVSKTCNVPTHTPWEDFKALYFKAWKGGAKGITTYRIGGKRSGILSEEACFIDPTTGERSCE